MQTPNLVTLHQRSHNPHNTQLLLEAAEAQEKRDRRKAVLVVPGERGKPTKVILGDKELPKASPKKLQNPPSTRDSQRNRRKNATWRKPKRTRRQRRRHKK